VIVRVPLMWVARMLAELVRDVLEALGAMLYAIGRATRRLLWIPTVVLIVYAIVVRATARVAMPPVVWPALTGAWVAATALWLVGGLLLFAARSRLGRAHTRCRRLVPPVSAARIQGWERAWLQSLHYQQMNGEQARFGHQRTSERQRKHEPGGAMAGSPYEILGVKPGVTPEQLTAVYRELAMRVHPDRNPGFVAEATERFAAINAAYELLSDPKRRAAYVRRSSGH
jgi:DnaJ domain